MRKLIAVGDFGGKKKGSKERKVVVNELFQCKRENNLSGLSYNHPLFCHCSITKPFVTLGYEPCAEKLNRRSIGTLFPFFLKNTRAFHMSCR